MTKFRWSGRTNSGQAVSGQVEAHSKEEVLSRLRAQHLAVTEVVESREGGEPADPDRGTSALKSDSSASRIFITLLLIAAAVIGALVYLGKIHIP